MTLSTDRYDPDAAHPTFVNELVESQKAVDVTAAWLRRLGFSVKVPDLRIRADTTQRYDFQDQGDLFYRERLEVKRRSLDFTSADDYPYPSVIIDECYKWDRAHPKPAAYIILNQARTHAAVVKRSTFRQWHKIQRHDKGRICDFYACPVSRVKFIRL